MSMKPNALLPMFLLCITALLVTGCTPKGGQLAEELQAAWANQQEVKTYLTSGSAELQLDLPLPDAEQRPLTSALLSSLLHSKYEWEGATDTDAARFETDMTITPASLDAAIHLPILIEEATLYFHLPMINKAEEYMKIPLGDQFDVTASQVHGLFAGWLEGVSAAADSTWLTESKAENPAHRSIHMTINEERLPVIMNAAADQWDQMLTQLDEAGLNATMLQDASLRATLRNAGFSKDGYLNFTLNEQGYIQEAELSLPFLAGEPSANAAEQLISIHYTWDRMNEEIQFVKAKPTSTKTLDAIFPLIK